ncbi:8780_t:CDS:2, partial [Gigaspora rosea]
VAKNAREAVQVYFDHMLNELSHQSKEFSKGLAEHLKHLKCVHSLIQGLQQLSDGINSYIRNSYPGLYEKMRKLDLEPNVPKLFGSFPIVMVNFNIISQFHQD